MKKYITLYAVCITSFIVVFALAFILWNNFEGFFDFHFPTVTYYGITLFKTGAFFIPIALAFFLSRKLSRWLSKKWSINLIFLNRTVITLLIILYFITGIIGTPAVIVHNDNWAVEKFKQFNEDKSINLSSSQHPYFRTIIAIPVLPFVVCSYHEYQIAYLSGWGGWDVQFWYFVGVKRLYSFTNWIS